MKSEISLIFSPFFKLFSTIFRVPSIFNTHARTRSRIALRETPCTLD